MKMTLLAGLFFAFSAPITMAEDEPSCSIQFQLFDKEIWTLRVETDRIEGDRDVLRRDGDVVFGFVGSKQTRLRFDKDSIEGRLAGVYIKLALIRGSDQIEVRGSAGSGRLSAKTTGNELVLANLKIAVTLKQVPGAEGTTVLRDETSKASLLIKGCGLAIMQERPEILLLLNQRVLQRVALFHDVP
jgi:hypothetical protein